MNLNWNFLCAVGAFFGLATCIGTCISCHKYKKHGNHLKSENEFIKAIGDARDFDTDIESKKITGDKLIADHLRDAGHNPMQIAAIYDSRSTSKKKYDISQDTVDAWFDDAERFKYLTIDKDSDTPFTRHHDYSNLNLNI